jgi:uncharacterized protein (TIGR00255 family)
MRSMTGFGEAAAENQRFAIRVQLRSVNHRFFDLKLRLDEPFLDQEAAVRECLGETLLRGRVDAAVEVSPVGEPQVAVAVQRGVLRTVHTAIHELVEEGLLASELRAGDLLRMPEIFQLERRVGEATAEDRALLLATVVVARDQLEAARAGEGASLERALTERLDTLEALAAELRAARPAVVAELQNSLGARVRELLDGVDLDPQRLAQEVALLADRSDIAEELDRLDAHLVHYRELMAATGSLGKRLDFLTQELLREVNTVGSKCRNAGMTRQVLEGKTAIEQLREQVQNVE